MSSFIVPSLKKIVGANLEKIDKVDFRYRHTDRHTTVILQDPDPTIVGGPKSEKSNGGKYENFCHGLTDGWTDRLTVLVS